MRRKEAQGVGNMFREEAQRVCAETERENGRGLFTGII